MNQRYAVIDVSNVVENVIMWDGKSAYDLPSGYVLVQSDVANIGDVYDSTHGTFTTPQ